MSAGELSYLKLVRKIISKGEKRDDRTGVGTLSLFGTQLKFDLREGFPLLTTKRIFFRGVVEELLWFLRGSTNTKELSSKGIHIWDDNSTREFLDSRGLFDYPEGELGPIYGYQWRNWGGDQLLNVLHQIKEDPNSRRIILSAWNVGELEKMALPPCHIMAQFQVEKNQYLNCSMYQRSADMGLGVPFNIASYALLVHLIARSTNLEVGTLTMSFGDTHIYLNHLEGMKIQLERTPRELPQIELISKEVKLPWEWTYEEIILKGYNPYGKIPLKMAI